ncbi:probable methyltransferase At1g27930 [Phalaenopsis equestris]|uniref:probable methyltransferase At1g27930 n=1 Tax=Phalaenopsis equestris TaxID=78828 RepID=UPI0009E2759B|nr:probable methyltransferase At1g27930 [Phalaenopsis equestris]
MSSKRKLFFLLIFISSTFYIFNFLKIRITTTRSPSMRLAKIPRTPKYSPFVPHKLTNQATFQEEEPFTPKELDFLSNIITRNQNRNLLFFGLNPQFLPLAEATTGGSVIFLEDDAERIQRFRLRTTYRNVTVHMVRYNEVAGGAYELLRHGREEPDCGRKTSKFFGETRCRLALSCLPQEVYRRKWDVVVVDGPRGNWPDAPGRMAAIYTAAVIARMGSGTDVVVHDVDRMIEKWFSWEFLCHDNLVSAKGKLWNFRINGTFQSDGFCPVKKVQIM